MKKRYMAVLIIVALAVTTLTAGCLLAEGDPAYASAVQPRQVEETLAEMLPDGQLDQWRETTPKAVSDATDWRIFSYQNQYAFLLAEDTLYPLCTMWGGWGLTSAVPWDYDDNGVVDLLYTYSWGSGIHRSHVAVFDAVARLSLDLEVVYAGYDEDAVVLPPTEAAPGEFPVYLADSVFHEEGGVVFPLLKRIGVAHIRNGVPCVAYTDTSWAKWGETIEAAGPEQGFGFPVDNETPVADDPAASIAELEAVYGAYRGAAMLKSGHTVVELSLQEAHEALPIPALRKCGEGNMYYAVYPVAEGGRYYAFFYAWGTEAILFHTVWLQELPPVSACAAIETGISTAEDVMALLPVTEFAQSLQYAACSFTLLEDGRYLELFYRYDREADAYIVTDGQIIPAETARHFANLSRILPGDLPQ